jgi:hypothetical protein
MALITSSAAAQTTEDYHPFLTDKFNIQLGIFCNHLMTQTPHAWAVDQKLPHAWAVDKSF